MLRVVSRRNYKVCKITETDPVVQSKSLVLTPQQCLEMSRQGVPITAQLQPSEMFQDGEPNPGDYVSMDRKRDVDINDMWNEEMRLRKHINGIVDKSRKKKGVEDAGVSTE